MCGGFSAGSFCPFCRSRSSRPDSVSLRFSERFLVVVRGFFCHRCSGFWEHDFSVSVGDVLQNDADLVLSPKILSRRSSGSLRSSKSSPPSLVHPCPNCGSYRLRSPRDDVYRSRPYIHCSDNVLTFDVPVQCSRCYAVWRYKLRVYVDEVLQDVIRIASFPDESFESL